MSSTKIETPWLNVATAAEYAGVSTKRILGWIKEHRLRASQLTERNGPRGRIDFRIHKDDLDAAIRAQPVAGDEAPAAEAPKRRKGPVISPGAEAIKNRFRGLK